MSNKPSYKEERSPLVAAILAVFIGLAFLICFQFFLHLGQTRDLQRRVGTLEVNSR